MVSQDFGLLGNSSKSGSLRIEIANKHPVELFDLTKSFAAFADEYRRFTSAEGAEAKGDDLRLYVTKIESGSIIAEVAAYAPALAPVLPILSDLYSLSQFLMHLKNGYDFLLGRSSERPNITKQSLPNLSNIVEPVAKDQGSQLNIGNVAGDLYIQLNSTEANAAQNAAGREIANLSDSQIGEHSKVLLYWFQARNERGNSPGDKAIIESITSRPVRVTFASDSIKAKMLFDEQNPFRVAYVVDVMVETINGRPALYKITALHEKFDRDDGGSNDSPRSAPGDAW
jgi:hypothetical protein